jgi:hypothetical protein
MAICFHSQIFIAKKLLSFSSKKSNLEENINFIYKLKLIFASHLIIKKNSLNCFLDFFLFIEF